LVLKANSNEGTTKGAKSRAAILDAAVPIMANNGYRGASLASIAEAAGLTQAGLLHHFPSKEQLLISLLDDRDHKDGQRVKASIAQHGPDVLASLEELVAYNATTHDLVQLFAVLVAEATSSDHPAHVYFVDRYERVRSRIYRTLRDGQNMGEVRSDVDIETLASVVVAVMDGLQIQWLLDPDANMVKSFQMFAALLHSALVVVPA
jgi:AcrR family transcriptional regulator